MRSIGATLPCCGCGATCLATLYPAPSFDATDSTIFTLTRCECCGLVRTEPVMTEQELGHYYFAPYYGSGQQKFAGPVEWLTRMDNQRRAHRLLALLRANTTASSTTKVPRILDIGCGRANLLAALARQGCECHGVERPEFPLDQAPPGIRFHRDVLDNLPLEANSFDAVVLWHVLEHVSDPSATLQSVARLVRPGGIVALAVPNFGSWQAALFKSAWFHLDLPRHTHHFDHDSLARLMQKQKLFPFKTSTWAFDQNIYGFIQSFFNRITPTSCANKMYSLLKNPKGHGAKLYLLGWLAAAGLIAPLALLEYLLSGFLGHGATLIVYACKPPQ